mgnify:CR=1 FL=1
MTFIVKNTTRHEISLGDLRAAIQPGKTEDLDRLASRHVIDQSNDLRIAVRRGALKVLKKDEPGAPTALRQQAIEVHKEQTNEEVLKQMQEMEKRLTARMNAQVSKHLDSPQGQGMDPEAIQQLNSAIQALQSITGGIVPQQQKTVADNVETEIPDDTSVEIHSRTIDRLTKGSKGQIKQDKIKGSSNVDKNIDELEGFL